MDTPTARRIALRAFRQGKAYIGRHRPHNRPTWAHFKYAGQVVIQPWSQQGVTTSDPDPAWSNALRTLARRRSPALAMR